MKRAHICRRGLFGSDPVMIIPSRFGRRHALRAASSVRPFRHTKSQVLSWILLYPSLFLCIPHSLQNEAGCCSWEHISSKRRHFFLLCGLCSTD